MAFMNKNRYVRGMSKRPLKVRVLLAMPLLSALVWALAGAAQTNPFFAPLKAGQLTGMKVENMDGQQIGTIHNLILDTRTGELKYAVIGSGGFLGMRPTLRLAPSQVMTAATAKRDTLAVSVATPRWKFAPTFKPSKLSSLAQSGSAREIADYFGQPTAGAHPLTVTGSENGERTNAAQPNLRFATDIIGSRVVNQKQEKVGEVLDLLVSFGHPRPSFAIISSSKLTWWAHEYAVPLSALKSTDQNRKLLLNADASALQQAPMFTEQAWEAGATNNSERVYRYLKSVQ